MMEILACFERASGLPSNFTKTKVFPINYNENQVTLIESVLHCQLVDFPYTYLSAPLSVQKLSKFTLQPLVDKGARCLPPWKGRHLNQCGHLILVKTTLGAILVHTSMAISIDPWAIMAIEKLM